MFANLCSSSASENPHLTMNKFFALQHLLDHPNPSSYPSNHKPLQSHKDPIPSPAEPDKKPAKKAPSMAAKTTSSKPPKPAAPESDEAERLEWANGDGLKEMKDMKDMLVNETRSWFLKYLEKTLDSGFKKGKEIAGRHVEEEAKANHIALTLSHLKHANEWLEKVRNSVSSSESEGMVETIHRLKQKVYSCLLLHVDSAASALENRSA